MQAYKINLFFLTILFGIGLLPTHSGAAWHRDFNRSVWNRPFLGVVVRDVPRRFQARYRLKYHEGVWVVRVETGSPADTAGILEGDIILRLNHKPIWGSDDFVRKIRRYKPGDEIQLDILENGAHWQARVRLTCAPQEWAFSLRFPNWEFTEKPWLGVKLQVLDEDLARYFGVNPADGVLIVSVERHSPAQKAGLKSGDILNAIEGRPVETPEDVEEVLADLVPGEKITLKILRNGRSKRVKVRLARAPQRARQRFFWFKWPHFYTKPRFWDDPQQWLYFQKERFGGKLNRLRAEVLTRTARWQQDLKSKIRKWHSLVTNRLVNEFRKAEQIKRNFHWASG